MSKYNGHKNWNCWNVNLWINNDEGLYALARDCVRQAHNKEEAAEKMLSMLNEAGIEKTPDGTTYSKTSIRAAMLGM